MMQALLEWKERRNGRAILIRGARQVGKTYLLKRFGEEHYSNTIYINFEDTPELRIIFDEDRSADVLYNRISYRFPETDLHDCLIIIDEIQSCPAAFSALKPLAADGRCDIAASGSLLGNVIEDGFLSPMGYIDTVTMEPMDFEEFLWASGLTESQTHAVQTSIRGLSAMDGFVRNRITDLFKRYITVGGMPAAVKAYTETGLYSEAVKVHKGIYDIICRDAKKYAIRPGDKLRIQECLDSIPRQLARESKIFNYTDIAMKKGYGRREYGSALLWLENAGIIDICRNLEEPAEPLGQKARRDSFKVYMKDTGLLTCMLGSDIASGIVNGDFYVNNGAVMENAVLEALVKKGYDVYFYHPMGRSIEIDFVLNLNGKIAAFEVKSGRSRRSRSLSMLIQSSDTVNVGIKVSNTDVSVDENGVIHIPLFGPCFLEDRREPDIGAFEGIDELKKALDTMDRSDN